MTSQPQELEADLAKVAAVGSSSHERSRDANEEGAHDSSGVSTPQTPSEPTKGSTNDGPETDAGDDLDTDFLDMLYFAPPPPETEHSTAEETPPPAPIDEEQWLKELEGDDDVPSIPVEEIWSDIVGGMSKIRIKQQEDEVADDDYADFVDCLDKEADDANDDEQTKIEKEAIYASFVEFFHSPEGQAMFATNGSEGVTADAMWEQIVSGMDQPGWYTPLWVRLGDCFAAEKGGKLDQHGHAIEEEVSPWLSCFKTLFAVNVVAAATEHTEEESKECDLEEGLNPLSPV